MKKVAILCGGGSSSEREVSLRSGQRVFEALKSQVDVEIFPLSEDRLPEILDPERYTVFPLIHGEFGEDGQLQELLEAKGFSYYGSDSIASRLCMDKAKAKEIARSVGVLTPKSFFFEGQSFSELWERVGGPFVIKPNDRGSSIGVRKVYAEEGFGRCSEGLNGGTWLVESCIEGREITVGILGTEALPTIEIRVKDGFYDYQHKYTAGMAEYVVPAPITLTETQYVQEISEKIFRACGCRDFARLDFILAEAFYFLEINTIPGMTETSLVPKAAAALGISFTDLCLKILQSPMNDGEEERKIIRILEDLKQNIIRF
ncbi:MAG: D-alanine--D-alanine ligase [Puniceicoccales bacterium]|jgi:D-alanine-D-alanine ligase|nr:D-alanine--D-alanine ligase [Puniceicoccales bacterium]